MALWKRPKHVAVMIFNYLLIYLGIKVTFGWYRGLLGVNATQAWNCHSCSEGVGEGIELYHAGPRLRCLVFNHWIAALCVLWVQYDSSIILVSTSCETCSHPSSVGCVGVLMQEVTLHILQILHQCIWSVQSVKSAFSSTRMGSEQGVQNKTACHIRTLSQVRVVHQFIETKTD